MRHRLEEEVRGGQGELKRKRRERTTIESHVQYNHSYAEETYMTQEDDWDRDLLLDLLLGEAAKEGKKVPTESCKLKAAYRGSFSEPFAPIVRLIL